MAVFCASVEAQESQNLPTPQAVPAPDAAPLPMPFSPGSETAGPAAAIEFRSTDRMSQKDRDLAGFAQSMIGERAGLAGIEFDQVSERGKWESQWIVCPALPNHLFLQFTRDNGKGDVSVFTASIPRGGDGRVRVIPVLRRGYSAFSPGGGNELAIAVFNRIRAEEHSDKDPSWLAMGLCYAALAGAHPEAGPPTAADMGKLPPAPLPILMFPNEGGAVISLADLSANPQPMIWTMTFDGKGKLVEATQEAAAQSTARTVVLTPEEVQVKTVPETPMDPAATQVVAPKSNGKVIQAVPVEVQGTPVPQ